MNLVEIFFPEYFAYFFFGLIILLLNGLIGVIYGFLFVPIETSIVFASIVAYFVIHSIFRFLAYSLGMMEHLIHVYESCK